MDMASAEAELLAAKIALQNASAKMDTLKRRDALTQILANPDAAYYPYMVFHASDDALRLNRFDLHSPLEGRLTICVIEHHGVFAAVASRGGSLHDLRRQVRDEFIRKLRAKVEAESDHL